MEEIKSRNPDAFEAQGLCKGILGFYMVSFFNIFFIFVIFPSLWFLFTFISRFIFIFIFIFIFYIFLVYEVLWSAESDDKNHD